MNNKVQITCQIKPETMDKIKAIQTLHSEYDTRNSVFEAAVDLLYGLSTEEVNQDYLCGTVGKKMESIMKLFSKQLSSLLFKSIVESSVTNMCVAECLEINRDTYEKLRRKALNDVKQTQGVISIYDSQG